MKTSNHTLSSIAENAIAITRKLGFSAFATIAKTEKEVTMKTYSLQGTHPSASPRALSTLQSVSVRAVLGFAAVVCLGAGPAVAQVAATNGITLFTVQDN